MAATDNDALLKAMDQLMKEEDRASVIEYAKQLSTKGGDVVGTMRKMSQQGVDTKKDAAMWKKRALLTAAAAVVVCAVMFGLMVASAELTKELHVGTPSKAGSGRRLSAAGTKGVSFAQDEDENLLGMQTATAIILDTDMQAVVADADLRDRRLSDGEDPPPQKKMEPAVIMTEVLGLWTGDMRRLSDEVPGRRLSDSLGVSFNEIVGSKWTPNGRRSLSDGTAAEGGELEFRYRDNEGGISCRHVTAEATTDSPGCTRRLSDASTQTQTKFKSTCHCSSNDYTTARACIKNDNTWSCT